MRLPILNTILLTHSSKLMFFPMKPAQAVTKQYTNLVSGINAIDPSNLERLKDQRIGYLISEERAMSAKHPFMEN